MTTTGKTTIPIRDVRATDLPKLADLWVAAWRATMPEIDFAARRAWFLDHLAASMAAGARTLVVHHNRRIAGFVMIDPRSGYLDQIAVAPNRQGTATARVLIEAAKSVAPGGIHLHVNTENTRAIGFYAKHGFVITGDGVNPNSGRPVHTMSWRP